MTFAPAHPESILWITLDSCRYDTFAAASTPNMDRVGVVNRAHAPGNFTYSSHAAMFVGFTPGVASSREAFVNPKFAKLFAMKSGVAPGPGPRPHVELEGRSVIDGLNRLGYVTVGSGAVGWFDPALPTGRLLTADFDQFRFSGGTWFLGEQLEFLGEAMATNRDRRMLVFLNVGETHVPYWHEGAEWDRRHNPCVPFREDNDAAECRRRQMACLEWVDTRLGPLLDAFSRSTTLICADHGDAWGEDGIWEHGVHHPTVLEVPLLLRTGPTPSS